MPVNPENYDDVVNAINKRYENQLKRGHEIENPPRLSTGSLELDRAMGGGVPIGRFTRFYGQYSSTKTLTGWSIIKSAQAQGLSCAYYNIEKQYDPDYAKELGVDIEKLTVVEGTTIEGIGEIMENLMGVVHVHVVDSCSAAVSEDELNASLRDWRPGLNARAWGKVFRTVGERFDHFENLVCLIDQIRVDFKTGGENPAGGKIFDHASSMSVAFRKGGWLFYDAEGVLSDKAKQDKTSEGQSVPAGRIIQARVEKSRVSRPLLPATMRLDFNRNQFDRTFEFVKAGKDTGVIRSRGAYFYYGTGDNEVRLHGDKKLREFITMAPEVREEIREAALAAVK